MEENNKSMFYIVAIIAVVAIVGLIVMVLNVSTGSTKYVASTTSTATDEAGQAVRAVDGIRTSLYYTKAEVDTLLANLNSQLRYGQTSISYDMIYRLNKCNIVKDYQTNGVVSCNDICAQQMKETVCVLAEYDNTIRPCNEATGSINTVKFCKCCGI